MKMNNRKEETYTIIVHWKGHKDYIRKGVDRFNSIIIPGELRANYPAEFELGLMSVEVIKEKEEAPETVTKWYVEISCPDIADTLDICPDYVIQSKWFDKKSEALEWGTSIDFVQRHYSVDLMCAEWTKDEDGNWICGDIEHVEIIKRR